MKYCFALLIPGLFAFDVNGQSAPAKKVELPGFVQLNDTLFVGIYEVSIKDYAKFLLYIKAKLNDSAVLYSALPKPNYTDWTVWNGYQNSKTVFDNDLITVTDSGVSVTAYLEDRPIVNISKEQASAYCKFRTEDYKVFYGRLNARKMKQFPAEVYFRLPTAEEWQMAAGPKAENAAPVSRENFNDTSKQFLPNPIFYGEINQMGLINMTGNVAEMVSDKDDVYGGSYKDYAKNCRPGSRAPYRQGTSSVGFRMVAVVKQK
jgi:formylglycine-generating enzyme required for sulfatase activity